MQQRGGMGLLGLLALLGLAALLQAEGASGARVLAVVPVPTRSHNAVLQALLRALAERGHSVTALAFLEPKPLPPNYTHVPLSLEFVEKSGEKWDMWQMPSMSYFLRVTMLWYFGNVMADNLYPQPSVQTLLNDESQHFDLVISEAFFNEAFLGLAHKYKAPLVQVCPFVGSAWVYDAVGSPSPAAYVPDPFLAFSEHMSFGQRLYNFVYGAFQALGRRFFYLPLQDAVMRKWLNASEPIPHVTELLTSTSLMLVNSHVSVSYPRPLTPALVPVAGMHIPPSKPLPQDLQKILDGASEGVVYFSMGSALESATMPEEKLQILLEVLGSLRQKVLWKWEKDVLPGKPKNVEIRKWLPQVDVLAHPNVRVFITHGGLLSSLEAIHHAVPMIGLPVFGDQQLNMERAERSGYAIKIDYSDLTANKLKGALTQILNEKRYKENARRLSQILKDQPETPLERAVWWVEYVLRHKGATHLRSAAVDLTWYQYYLLDVLFVISLVVLTVTVSSLWILKCIFQYFCSKQKAKQLKSQNKAKKKN